MNIFDTYTMNEAIREIKPVGGFFLNLFKRTKFHDTSKLTVDLYKGDRRLAPYTTTVAKSKPFDRNKFSSADFEAPQIKLNRSLEPVDTILRSAGESPYAIKTPMQRAMEIMAQDQIDMNLAIVRAEELQAAQAIIKGQIVIIGEDVNQLIDLRRDPLNTFALGALPSGGGGWTNSTDIGTDLRFMRSRVFANSGYSPNIVMLGDLAINALLKNAKANNVQLAQNMFGNALSVPENQDLSSAQYYGIFESFQIWGYSELYNNGTADVAMLGTKDIVMISPSAQGTRNYGPILHMKSLQAVPRFSYAVEEQDPSIHKQVMESRPLMTTDHPDAYANATVLP